MLHFFFTSSSGQTSRKGKKGQAAKGNFGQRVSGMIISKQGDKNFRSLGECLICGVFLKMVQK
jgi:hypothetical protein